MFRRLTIDDLAEVMAIERPAFEHPWSAAMMRDSLRDAHQQGWGLFEDNGKMVGFGVLSIVMDEAELLAMSVDPTMQGQGYGEALLGFLIERAKKAEAEQLFLEVRQSNDPANGLYRKMGFDTVGERRGYYPGARQHERENAALMMRVL